MTILLRVCLVVLAAVVLAAPVAAEPAPKVAADNGLLACGYSPTTAFAEYMQSRAVTQPEREYEFECTWNDEVQNPFLLRTSLLCPACGHRADVCIGKAACRYGSSNTIEDIVLYCEQPLPGACPDASTCANQTTLFLK